MRGGNRFGYERFGGTRLMKICVFTLGCKVNSSESDSLIKGLKDRGYEVTDELEKADLYIVNTCAVTAEAEKKSRQTSSRIKKLNPDAKIIYTGCACEKNPDNFSGKSNVSLITGTFDKGKILDMLDESGVKIAPHNKVFEELLPIDTLRARSYIKVQDGCNNFCSYCIIPYLRGRSRSRSPESIIEEINSVNSAEIVLNGINLSAYDSGGLRLCGLIKRLNGVKCRIRLGSLEVGVIDEDFLNALKEVNFAPHFHLSLQSGSDSVLKSMNRHYTTEEFYEKVQLIRKHFPSAGITTDIIVGFPTETDECFAETVEFVKKVKFSDIHCFNYSPRSGTVAYKLKDLPPEIKKVRLDALLNEKQICRENFENVNIGNDGEVVIEEVIDGYSVGYTGNYIRTYIPGEYTGVKKVKLTERFKDGMKGE